jgi:hypothetical protein
MKYNLIRFKKIIFLSIIFIFIFSFSTYSKGKDEQKIENNTPKIINTPTWVLADKDNFYSVETITSIKITPIDTVVNLGASFSFNGVAYDSNQNKIDTTFIWSTSNNSIGTIDSIGLFTAKTIGEVYVIIILNGLKDSAHVSVIDTSLSGTINTATIQKVLPNGKLHNKIDIVQEGSGEYKFGGFPSPLNILNGGKLQFPIGSINNDINITIKLPQFAKIEGDSVSRFELKDTTKVIVSAVEFIVTVKGDTISPYYFNKPILVSLPYKRGLLAQLGLNPEDITMAFYSDTVGPDTSGITNVVIDSARNRIIATVAHFSTIVLYAKNEGVISDINDNHQVQLPNKFLLEQNYPNPFNPETKIKYSVPKPSMVTIKIYNILGQEVRTLVDKLQSAGTYEIIWDGKNNLGNPVSSGIYIYQMHTKDFVHSKRMVLLR